MENKTTGPVTEDENLTENTKETASTDMQGEVYETFIHPPEEESAAEDKPAEEKKNATEKHARAKENLSVFWTFLSTFFIACVVIAAAALVGVKATGCYLFSVETGSMTPTYPVNTVVVVKPYSSFEEIQVGDVVTYVMNEAGTTVTHRVVSIDAAGETVTTQGDANDTADASPVLYGNVVGKVIIGIPKIGKIVKIFSNEDYRIPIIVIIAALLVWAFVWDWIRMGIRKRKSKKVQGKP